MNQRVSSLSEVARRADSEKEFSYLLRDFLDGFYEAPSATAFAEEPVMLAPVLVDDGRADAYLAAGSGHYGINLPDGGFFCGWAGVESSLRRGLRNQHARVVRSPEEESNAIALAGACELNELFLGAMLVRLLCMDVRCRCY